MRRTAPDKETTLFTLTRSVATFGQGTHTKALDYILFTMNRLSEGVHSGIVREMSANTKSRIEGVIKKDENPPVDALAHLIENGEIGVLEITPLLDPKYLPTLTNMQQKAVLYGMLLATKDVLYNSIAYLDALGVKGADRKYASIQRNINRELQNVKRGIERGDVGEE